MATSDIVRSRYSAVLSFQGEFSRFFVPISSLNAAKNQCSCLSLLFSPSQILDKQEKNSTTKFKTLSSQPLTSYTIFLCGQNCTDFRFRFSLFFVVNKELKIITSVGAKRLFLQPQLLRNIDLIIQLLIIFFSDNATVFNKIYTQHLNGYKKATYKISFFPDECFVRK